MSVRESLYATKGHPLTITPLSLDSLKKNGIEWVKDLGRKNVENLMTVIQWNEDNVSFLLFHIFSLAQHLQNIRFFRLSSEMFPYASHGVYGYSLDYCAPLLAKAGALANKYGHRLTTHPGQYTQLGSPKPAVVEAAVRELVYHCEMLDLLGTGPNSVMIIHVSVIFQRTFTRSLTVLGRVVVSTMTKKQH